MVEIKRLPEDLLSGRSFFRSSCPPLPIWISRIDPPSSAHKLTHESLAQKAQDEICYIATDSGVLVGCVFFRPEPPHCLYIGKLAISAVMQGRGLGRKLLAHAEHEAVSRGLANLRLKTASN